MEKKKYVVYEEDLLRMLEAEAVLNALENGGVDNWNYYGEAINDSLNGTGYATIGEFVEGEVLPSYQELK